MTLKANINIIKKNIVILIETNKDVGPERNAEKGSTVCSYSIRQNAG
jgi:hypothetical protein